MPGTPSEYRTLKNARADLKRSGLVHETERRGKAKPERTPCPAVRAVTAMPPDEEAMTPTIYNVRAEYGDVRETLPDSVITAVHDELARYDVSIGSSPAGGLTVRLFLDADSPVDAGVRGVEYIKGTLLKHDIFHAHRMTGFEVITAEEFDRRLAEPLVPELAGMTEVAQIAGRTTGRASQLRAALAPYLVQELASGPVYLAAGVRAFAENEHYHTRGVRRTEIPLSPIERALLDFLAAAAAGTDVASHTAGHQAVAKAIEGIAGNRHQLHLHFQPAGSEVSAALGTLREHGLVRTRRLFKKETSTMAAGHENDLVVSLTEKGQRRAGTATPAADEENHR